MGSRAYVWVMVECCLALRLLTILPLSLTMGVLFLRIFRWLLRSRVLISGNVSVLFPGHVEVNERWVGCTITPSYWHAAQVIWEAWERWRNGVALSLEAIALHHYRTLDNTVLTGRNCVDMEHRHQYRMMSHRNVMGWFQILQKVIEIFASWQQIHGF